MPAEDGDGCTKMLRGTRSWRVYVLISSTAHSQKDLGSRLREAPRAFKHVFYYPANGSDVATSPLSQVLPTKPYCYDFVHSAMW